MSKMYQIENAKLNKNLIGDIVTVSKVNEKQTSKAPVWFQIFVKDQFIPLVDRIGKLENRIGKLENRVEKLENRVEKLENEKQTSKAPVWFQIFVKDQFIPLVNRIEKLENRIEKLEKDVKNIYGILERNNIS